MFLEAASGFFVMNIGIFHAVAPDPTSNQYRYKEMRRYYADPYKTLKYNLI